MFGVLVRVTGRQPILKRSGETFALALFEAPGFKNTKRNPHPGKKALLARKTLFQPQRLAPCTNMVGRGNFWSTEQNLACL